MKHRFKSHSLQTILIFSFSLTVAFVASVLIASNYYFGKKMAIKSMEVLVDDINRNVLFKVHRSIENTKMVLKAYKSDKTLSNPTGLRFDIEKVKILKRMLSLRKNVDQAYIGYGNGLFYELVKEKNGYLNRMIQGGVEKDIYLDKDLHIRKEELKKRDYDHRVRGWYKEALASGDVIVSSPYMFANVKKMGITFSTRMQKRGAVLAIDSNLESLDDFFKVLIFDNIENIFLFQKNGQIYVSAKEKIEKQVPQSFFQNPPNRVFMYEKGKKDYIAVYSEIFKDNFLAVVVDIDKVVKPYSDIFWRSMAMAIVLLFFGVVLVIAVSRVLTKTVRSLILENNKIQKREFESVSLVATRIREFRSLSRSQVTMARSIAKYQKQLKSLLDSIIQLIAKAIDAKSHYTAGHCERVPILAEMILEALDEDNGKFADFHIESQEEKEAFRIGAWLHDCGKVTTPEYVVDKATKLETVYNRIHEIRMRFEVLYRDAYIRYLEERIDGVSEEEAKKRLKQTQQELQEDFSFVAECNVGGEYLDKEKKERLKQIAQKEWLRYFDDSLGLGEIEKMRYEKSADSLPVVEKLLSDKPSHIIERENFDYEAYKRYGFTMPVPKHLYNLGELYNLSVEKGTLTPEERFKINEHVIATIEMLEAIPFPDAMKNIPKYAGTHHEKLDCSGYPRGLCAEDLGIPDRVMAISDVFEALCASDRPYKKPKTLSQTLRIMSFMVKDGHIDGDIFAFFVEKGIYKEYAKRFLKPEQIDEVDEASIIGKGN